MRKFIALLLVFAVLLPTASATAQTERLLPSNVASISSKNEALSLYQSLVAGNSNQMEKEVYLQKELSQSRIMTMQKNIFSKTTI